MNTAGGKKFRNAINGYNKEDVNQYIMEADRQVRDSLEETEDRLRAAEGENRKLTEERDTLKGQLEDLSKEKAAMASDWAEEKARLEKAAADSAEKAERATKAWEEMTAQAEEKAREAEREREKAEALEKSLAEYQASLAGLETMGKEEAEALRRENEGLKAEKELLQKESAEAKDRAEGLAKALAEREKAFRAAEEQHTTEIVAQRAQYEAELRTVREAAKSMEGAAYKLDLYDKISSQIGDILISANRNSDDIISSAKQEAERILLRANEEAGALRTACEAETEREKNALALWSRDVRAGLSDAANLVLKEIREELAGCLSGCVRETQTCVTEMQYEGNALLAVMEQKQAEINEKLDFYGTSAADKVKEKLMTLEETCDSLLREPEKQDGGAQ